MIAAAAAAAAAAATTDAKNVNMDSTDDVGVSVICNRETKVA